MKTSHDAQPTNSEMKEITFITAMKEYSTGNTFDLYITAVGMHFCLITKLQITKQENFLRWSTKLVAIQ